MFDFSVMDELFYVDARGDRQPQYILRNIQDGQFVTVADSTIG